MNLQKKIDGSSLATFLFIGAVVVSMVVFTTAIKNANAIDDEEMRTVFAIADIADYGSFVSLQAYIVFGDQLILAETWQVPTRLGGAVGLAVDQQNELLFMSFEQGTAGDDDDFDEGDETYNAEGPETGGGVDLPSHTIDVFSARDGSYITQIDLPVTSNLAGMVVHQARGHLYVVDRGDRDVFVFDTNNNFTLVTQWVLPTGSGAWGIDLHDDILYITDADPLFTHYVRWYDIDTRQELGSYNFTEEVTGIVVMNDRQTPLNGPLIYTSSYDGGLGAKDTIQRYAIGSGTYTSAVIGNHTAGISANPDLDLVYISHAGTLFTDPLLKVIDVNNGQVLNSYTLTAGNSPTDVVASNIPFGGTVSKTLTSHPSGIITMGQTASFEIEIENRSNNSLVMIPLEDIYDPTHFTYVSATPTPDNIVNGNIVWNDLTTALGTLPAGQTFTIYMDLMATDSCTVDLEGSNLAQVMGALDSMGSPMYAAGVADYTIECSCSVDADCDDGLFCNGDEVCVDGQCESQDPPCPDDGLYCNGAESCNEITNQCESTGDPCPDDNIFCNGAETCDETSQACDHAGDPCANDGNFCNGEESCNETADQCDTTEPCPQDSVFCNGEEDCDEDTDTCIAGAEPCGDDGLYCNGTESCDEDSASCVHSGEPCVDDGLFCNGSEVCDEDTDSCVSAGDPCTDDGLFCNGGEFCDEDNQTCGHSGDPCPPGQECNEETDECTEAGTADDDDDDDDAGDLWPKGEVTGGCCGC